MKELDSRRFLANPQFQTPLFLVYGVSDADVDGAARALLAAFGRISGDHVEVSAVSANEVADDPSMLNDFLIEETLFGERRALWIASVGDRFQKTAATFLDMIRPSKDLVLFSSSTLRKSSKLVAAMHVHPMSTVLTCYPRSLSVNDISELLNAKTPAAFEPEALSLLSAISASLDAQSFDTLLEKIALYLGDAPNASFDDVALSLPADLAENDAEILELLLLGERAKLLAEWRRSRLDGLETAALSALLGRQLSMALSYLTAAQSGRSAPRLFWKLEKAITSASRRVDRLPNRLEQALMEIHRYERDSRSRSYANDVDAERLLFRLSTLFRR